MANIMQTVMSIAPLDSASALTLFLQQADFLIKSAEPALQDNYFDAIVKLRITDTNCIKHLIDTGYDT